MRPPAPAVIVGLDTMQGLQAARILAERGVPVVGIAADPSHYACATNVCDQIVICDTRTEAVVEWLEEHAPAFPQKPVLIPCDDPQVRLLSRHRRRLTDGYHLPLPAPEVIELLIDKVAFYEHAQNAGLPIPETRFLSSEADAETAAAGLRFPVVVKPPTKAEEWSRHTTSKGFKLTHQADLVTFYRAHAGWADPLIVQEWVEGPASELYSCNCYFDATSSPLVTFVARKIRQWPSEVGDSSLGVECREDRVADITVKLFDSVGYHGLGYVELKRDPRSGEFVIMEPNVGRPTGRSAIAEGGGVELLYTMYCDTVGLPLPADRRQTFTGVKWVNLRKDTQSALYSWRRGELTIREWRESWRGRKVYAVWSWRDPKPFFVDLITSLRRVIGGRVAQSQAEGVEN